MISPMLILNDEIDIKKIQYPQLASLKMDGLRLFVKQDLLTRSLKQIPNKQVREKFNFLKEYSIKNNIILDGEIYCHEIPFQMIQSCVMTDDYTDKKSIKAWAKLCKKHSVDYTREQALEFLKFYCFDCIMNEHLCQPFGTRADIYKKIGWEIDSKYFVSVIQREVNNPEDVEKMFEEAINLGYEGLILKDKCGEYKCGRTTYKENLGYKVKLFITLDGKIIGIEQATKAREGSEKKTNELGRSVSSKLKEDRVLINQASGFVVDYKGQEYTINLKMNVEEKKYIWEHQDEYIGKWVEYKCMEYGMKKDGLPRHGKTNQDYETIRMRYDKDDSSEDSHAEEMIQNTLDNY